MRKLACLVTVAACATHDELPPCADCTIIDDTFAGDGVDHDDEPIGDPPNTLLATGLCADDACTTINAGIDEFQPRWALWSDGATKRRWIYLPPGTQIDTTQPDYWRFPVGTKLWKEFTRDGVRVETRFMEKLGPGDGDWLFMAYEWNADDSAAAPVPDGDTNVHGTAHDIPSQATCLKCHGNVKSRVLGFGALQLDYAAPTGMIDLDDALAAGWLSTPCAGPSSPHYPVPGNDQQRATLGYFHANCGHCHNSQSPLVNRPSFRLETGYLASLADTRTYRTTVNVAGIAYGGATIIAKPGDPDRSIIVTRMRSTDPKKRMPWLGGETLDPTGYALIRAWITSL
jgi:hypothetical protein